MRILIVNGPNINLLGIREPEIYGYDTLDKINDEIREFSKTIDEKIKLEFYQSNVEGEIINKIQQSKDFDGLIINPAAYTHTSIAIADAIKGVGLVSVEVHLSNINSREEFRKKSFISPVSMGVIAGFGKNSYKLALLGLYKHLTK